MSTVLVRFTGLCLATLLLTASSSSGLAQNDFASSLKQAASGLLGIDQFKDYLASLTFGRASTRGQDYVQTVARDINKSVNDRADAVRRLKAAIVSSGSSSLLSAVMPCCPVQGLNLHSDARFPYDSNDGVYCRYGKAPLSMETISDSLLSTMKQNMDRNPSLKWQYFGTESGTMIHYPASSSCSNRDYDPRLRPWYSFTATYPKDVVVMIDKSSSMDVTYVTSGSTKLFVAIRAALSVIDSLNPNDNVGVLTFSNNVEPASTSTVTCYANQLALATSTNKQSLKQFILGIQPSKTRASYAGAFRDACSLLAARNNGSDGQPTSTKVILLLANGDPVDSLSTINDSVVTGCLRNMVTILTFGLNTDEAGSRNLDAISQMTGQGNFGSLSDSNTDTIRTQIGVYYNYFTKSSDDDNVVFSVPYNDSAGLGMVTSACLPVFNLGSFKGVTCIDIPIDTIFNQITYFHLSGSSYAFLVDAHGRMLLHPLLPQPETYKQDPIFLGMQSVEISPVSNDVQRYMMSGTSGNLSTPNLRLVQPRGYSPQEGVTLTTEVRAAYFWAPIAVMNASVCVVMLDGEYNLTLTWTGSSYPDVYLADEVTSRIDDVYSGGKCNNFGRVANKDVSAVKLSPMSFLDSFFYTAGNVTNYIQQIKAYLTTGRINNNYVLKAGVREGVAITNKLEGIWKNATSAAAGSSSSQTSASSASALIRHAVYRYVGTRSGVFRIFPALRLPRNYDPTKQPWYGKAAALKSGQIALMTTAKDSGQTAMVTMSAAFYDSIGGLLGVLGADVPCNIIYTFITTQFDSCTSPAAECFAIDRSGFIIAHRDFLENGPTSAVHITTKEQSVATELIRNNIMTNDSCVSYADITNQFFWKVQPNADSRVLTSVSIFAVTGFDLFVISKSGSAGESTAVCSCEYQNSAGKTPCSINRQCQCPCYTATDYSYCSGHFTITENTKACYPPLTPLYAADLATEERDVVAKLPPCLDCSLFTTQQQCTATGCCWSADANTPNYCFACSNTPTPTPSPSTACSSLCLGLAIGISLGVALLIAVAVIVIWKRDAIRERLTHRGKRTGTDASRQDSPATRTTTPEFGDNKLGDLTESPVYAMLDLSSAYMELPPAGGLSLEDHSAELDNNNTVYYIC